MTGLTCECPLLRALGVAELRDAIMFQIGNRGLLCRSRLVSKTYALRVDEALESLSQPLLLLNNFFVRPGHAADMLRRTGSLLSGDCIRLFVHSFSRSAIMGDVLVSAGRLELLLSHLRSQAYKMASSAGTIEQWERERRWLSSETLLLVGGPDGRRRLNVVVCADEPLVYLLRNPLPQNMQAFDGASLIDLYPAFGDDGVLAMNGIAVQGLSVEQLRKFVPRARRLGNIVPPERTITTVHRFLGDAQCLILPANSIPSWVTRNSWEVRLHVNIMRDGRSWVVFDAATVSSAVLRRTYSAARDLGDYLDKAIQYTLSDVTLGLRLPPMDWDEELDAMITAFRGNCAYSPAQFPRQGPFQPVSFCTC